MGSDTRSLVQGSYRLPDIRVIGLIRGPRPAEMKVASGDLTVEYGRGRFDHEWHELHEWGTLRGFRCFLLGLCFLCLFVAWFAPSSHNAPRCDLRRHSPENVAQRSAL